ncbi:hypothetical protein PSQ90_09265 [Devosia rhodophyticola]|uniref:Tripartite tricarboxylate transporter TctB family protein n=1 Tax=Devosia rhodophyticola TaxID=3026423 RepID=A0ABY7YT88_9HYPH|nr:hypothetical protein [Devosia rhodophyticola]WDR04526.1 hypothetical protein PSQ90_09265 [Devosia rhodophyticola]
MTDEKRSLRQKDFWAALALMAASAGLLFKTLEIPFFQARAAGIADGKWYNSAAIVPYMVFGLLFVLSVTLLVISIRGDGLPTRADLEKIAAQARAPLFQKFCIICLMLLAYIFGLVPRVDFTLATALVMMALTYGFYEGRMRPAILSLILVLLPSVYAMIVHFPSEQWAKPHDDDIVTLIGFVVLVGVALVEAIRTHGSLPGYLRYVPIISFFTPLLLVIAMAFGFHQNVPNRTGLLFSQIEYHYYVTLKPLLDGRKD